MTGCALADISAQWRHFTWTKAPTERGSSVRYRAKAGSYILEYPDRWIRFMHVPPDNLLPRISRGGGFYAST